MKTIKLIFITLSCLLVLAAAKHRATKKHRQPGVPQPTATTQYTQPKHIQDMVVGNPNTMVKDRHFLWKDSENRNLERPYLHGVVGPQWQVPVAEDTRGFDHIASPMPRPTSSTINRIVPNELPPVTYSQSSFDMPLRKDVIQADIPPATIRTVEENIDPRFPPKTPVAKVSGTLYHGTGSVDARIVHGLPSFLEKKSRKHKARKHSNKREHISIGSVPKIVESNRSEGLEHARAAEHKVDSMIFGITNSPVESNQMILGVDSLNRREQPSINLYENNAALQEGLERKRYTPAGVRAAHSFKNLP